MFTAKPIAYVRSPRTEVSDDFWGGLVSEIELADGIPTDSLDGVEEFSHIEVVFFMGKIPPEAITTGTRHPRNNTAWPRVGVFAQRAKARPNRIGCTIAKLVSREGRVLRVERLDAIDGTPVLDIKPVLAEFLPSEPVRQPEWSRELMKDYWRQP